MLMVNGLTASDIASRGFPVLDLYLAQLAEDQQKKIGAVERVEEQCLPLNGLTYGQVIFALNQTLQQHEDVRHGRVEPSYTTDDLIQNYQCGNLNSVVFNQDTAQVISCSKKRSSWKLTHLPSTGILAVHPEPAERCRAEAGLGD